MTSKNRSLKTTCTHYQTLISVSFIHIHICIVYSYIYNPYPALASFTRMTNLESGDESPRSTSMTALYFGTLARSWGGNLMASSEAFSFLLSSNESKHSMYLKNGVRLPRVKSSTSIASFKEKMIKKWIYMDG